jgi:hypothetical protein
VALNWPGKVSMYVADGEDGYVLDDILPVPSVVGETLDVMTSAASGVWDRGPALRVRLVRGTLASVSVARVIGGANLAAIGDGRSDRWELFQFADAELVGPRTYDLRLRLRGQFGTDGVIPPDWPKGSRFVLMDGVPRQIGLTSAQRGLSLTWRWGPTSRPIGDASYRSREVAFQGVGLRPYSVCHLRARTGPEGAIDLNWVRRTRIDGDLWGTEDVPLGESAESYVVQIIAGGTQRREVRTSEPSWRYSAGLQATDEATAGFLVRVAQISDRFGPGAFRDLWVSPP